MTLRCIIVCLLLGLTPRAAADTWSKFFPHDVDVITVTDITEAGRAYAPATPAHPVYYMIIDLGRTHFGREWSGEQIPDRREVRQWMMKAMAAQGYRLADAQHKPTQLFVFAWGMMGGGPGRAALYFLGGNKVDLMWEQETHAWVDATVLRRDFQRMGVAGKVWDAAESNLFLGIVKSYTMDSLDAPATTLLWETRFGCPSDGLGMRDAMPLLIRAAALNLGKESKQPVALNASDAFAGHVDLGEMKVIETDAAVREVEEAKPETPK